MPTVRGVPGGSMTANTKGWNDAVADSVVFFRNSQQASARGTLISVGRNLVIFEVYNPYSIVQLSEVLPEIRLTRRGKTIYAGRAMVSNIVSTGLMLIVSAALVDPWSDLAGVGTREGVREEVDRFLADWDRSAAIDPQFQVTVNRLKNFLVELARWLEGTELTLGQQAGVHRQPLPRELFDEVYHRTADRLASLFNDFEVVAAKVDREHHAVHKNFAQRELHPLTMVSPWVHRCYSKPFGYAGDFEMLNMTLRDPCEGPNSYAWLINRLILATDPPIAYANRITMLVEHLRHENQRVRRAHGRPLKALTIGCGPANEVQRFMREDPAAAGCVFHLMDFNQPTIDFARSRIESTVRETGRAIQPVYELKSIHELLQEARGRRDGIGDGFDMIYCAGLFDYLSDRICGNLIELFASHVNPGGIAIVTNVAHSRPIVGSLELLMEWYLIYRSGADMLKLKPGIGEQTVREDVTGINQFLVVRKPG
jgi:extracellular factor (EF) 3-hydroxypalmitic acid methyl ester biosynthesis protein